MARASVPPEVSPEEREARIRELRARRKARMRTLALRSAIGTTALVALVLVAGWWLLGTLGGRDFLLSQVVSRLPAGTTLEWRAAEGPASGPLTLHDVVFQQLVCPEVDDQPVPYGQCAAPNTLRFSARRITLDPALRPLLGRTLRLDAAQVEGALLELPPSDDGEPFSLPRWPEVLPQIEPPLGLQADTIEIDGFRVLRGGEPLIDIADVRGGVEARSGLLRLRQMMVHSDRGDLLADGEYAPADDYRMDLTVSALLPAPAGSTRPRLGLVARGDVSALDVALSGHAPAPVRVALGLRGAGAPEWSFSAVSEALDPALLAGLGEPGTPVAFDLAARGTGGRAELQGDLAYGDLRATIQPSVASLDEQVLEFDPLVVDVLDGRVTVTGRGDFRDPKAADLRYAVVARGVSWSPTPDAGAAATPAPTPDPAATIRADADLGIAGTAARWAVVGQASLERDGEIAEVELKGRGDQQRLDIGTLVARTPTGRLEGSGHVAWAPALGWDFTAALTGFDPGYFAPGFDGAIDGRLATTGSTRDDGGLDLRVDADALGGQLRGRRLGGRAGFAMRGAAPGGTGVAAFEGEAALSVGQSRIDASGRVDDRLDIQASLAPLRLDDLLPGAAGRIEGQVTVAGGRDSPDVRADLAGSGLRYADYTADRLQLRGHLPWRGGGGTLDVDAAGIQAGIALDTLSVQARGAVEDLRLDARAAGGIGTASLSGSARRANGLWRGTLDSLQAAPALGASWQLGSAANVAQTAGGGFTLAPACLASDVGGRLCASADWPRQGLAIDGQALPLALVGPYLPTQDSGRPWFLDGSLDIDARLRPAGNAWQGHVNVASGNGALRTSARSRRDVLSYSGLALEAVFDANRIDASLGLGFNGNGRITARLRTGWDAYAPLEGQLTAATSELTWLELFSPDIVSPTGRLDADVALSGTRAAPALGGYATLSDFAAELPALAIAIVDGQARLDALPDGNARISGSLGTGGDGRLAIDGSLGWRSEGAPLQLRVSGRDVLVSDTRDLRAVASPDIEVRYAAGLPLQVTGRVLVPSARMDLERLSDGVSASPDVVVLDPVDPEEGPSLPMELDLTLAMGDDVSMNGFGLEGALTGELRVVSRAGREMTGHGLLEVGGRYEAYGQELAITRGRLSWSNTPVSDPLLDIRAERRVGDVTAGIDVSGRASAPRAQVWTDPSSDESEALALLALGRPLSSLSGRQASDLDAASAALNAGGSLLAGQIGKRIGLDDAGVMESRTLGGSVFGIGKQLSPRLYVGFGVSLLGSGQVLTLKYLLRKGFDVEIESSSLESRGSINYRHER
ncbi:translocation/assembly module TamB domain-containing protein [Luteimonas sp. MC1750]|uniref:translocation/assembly module TamB domain-containing protein n=1 Tax=Luteimonas sp. MC1750 TaxID=2799326 RepID=UPI0018F0FE0A|nr:translocation/assembly module TamB domain-containing protein [Luteimonas sp. MC1750]MBJ6985186.1 translocation/assembly module TamB domain-containing protein [Luteimonas sp. MC1750]QQO05838.1 translocation/assembly module TamB domain-containing protein [Luteimonas sp. MC1750]